MTEWSNGWFVMTTKGWVASSILVDFAICSFRASALETIPVVMIVCAQKPVGFGEGRAPEITVSKSKRFYGLENTYFVGYS